MSVPRIQVSKVAVITITTTIVVAIVLAIYYYNKSEEHKKLAEESEADKFRLMQEALNNTGLTEEIRRQLAKLIQKFEKVDEDVTAEIVGCLQQFQIGEKERAIVDLVKIVENLCSKLFRKKSEYKDWIKSGKRKDDLCSLLDFANKPMKIITKVELGFLQALRSARNEESHEINITFVENISASAMLTAICGIVKIGEELYPQEISA